jgi:hypothetical protein
VPSFTSAAHPTQANDSDDVTSNPRASVAIGHDPEPPRLEHFGFKVESVEAVKRDMEEIIGSNPLMVTKPLGYGSEGKARLEVFKQCPIGQFHLTDIEGVYVDVTEH